MYDIRKQQCSTHSQKKWGTHIHLYVTYTYVRLGAMKVRSGSSHAGGIKKISGPPPEQPGFSFECRHTFCTYVPEKGEKGKLILEYERRWN